MATWTTLRARALAQRELTPFDHLVVALADMSDNVVAGDRAAWADCSWQYCHGDLHLDNLLFDDNSRVCAILDFDNAAPGWPALEIMMLWNLTFCPDPGRPVLTPEGHAFFQAYRRSGVVPDHVWSVLPLAYAHNLLGTTWPAPQRYQQSGSIPSSWVEVLDLRYRAAQWLLQHADEMAMWLTV